MNRLVNVLTRPRSARRRREEASWLVVLPVFFLFMSALAAARTMPAWGAFLLVAGAFGALAMAGWLWGADSRDGSDWKPRKPGAMG